MLSLNLKQNIMQNRIIKLGAFAMLLSMLTGCEAIGDIFKAGMGFGIFIVIAVVVLVIKKGTQLSAFFYTSFLLSYFSLN
jgi:hypothetical protein